MDLTMTKAEREAFLAETHVGILSVMEPGRAPLSLPVWYRYEPGGAIRISTGGASRKAQLLRQAGRASFCVQTETPPYKYVSVEGPVTFGVVDRERDVREMAHRYLGEQLGEWYVQSTAAEQAGAVLVMLEPQRWRTVDYAKMSLG